MVATVGDCKAYHWSAKTGKATEVTYGNRHNCRDPKDPGGRLGPQLKGGAPDLRNLSTFYHPCTPGTIEPVPPYRTRPDQLRLDQIRTIFRSVWLSSIRSYPPSWLTLLR